jgi:toxin ParE1/3/4
MKLRWTTEAYLDTTDIAIDGELRYGAKQSAEYLRRLHDSIARLSRFPEMMRLRTELAHPARILISGAHAIVYNIEDGEIVLIRILPARADIADALANIA